MLSLRPAAMLLPLARRTDQNIRRHIATGFKAGGAREQTAERAFQAGKKQDTSKLREDTQIRSAWIKLRLSPVCLMCMIVRV